ncbi:hypothetical protein B0H19DRAFT_1214630 [Mycena capillaripes]|nr:hypothetical protein B0H19DRAFT_1214630 [Mycena capillaripes]
MFSAGEVPAVDSSESIRIWREMENLEYYDHTIFADMKPMMADMFDKTDDCTLSDAVRAMAAMGLDESDEEDDDDSSSAGVFNEDWAPHGSKAVGFNFRYDFGCKLETDILSTWIQMFMLDLLDNLPRLRLSDDHLKAIIWVIKECGTPNVPSFYALQKMQKKLTQDVDLKPHHHTSSLNNQFYMNHPNDLLRLDFSNPLPEITTTVSESWQAEKYVKEIEDDDLSPMWANWDGASHRHFYIKELAQSKDGKYYIPLKWITYKKQVHCDAYLVSKETRSSSLVSLVPIFALSYSRTNIGVQDAFTPHMPHPVREIAQGRPVFVLRIMPWADDVSGNRSKQYNAHMNMYIAKINLPHQLLSQEYFVRFCATSQYASSLEQFDALAEDCMQNKWTPTYDCKLQQEILFRIGIHLLPADNPQQAENTSTAGSSANLWCREDDSGGSATHRETDEGYHALFAPGKPRTPADTVAKIKEQIRSACLGVASVVENLQTESGVKDKISVHWIELLLDRARKIQQARARQLVKQGIINEIQEEMFDWVIMQPPERYEKLDEQTRILVRPCEILHTVLLGEDEYVWYETTKGWNDEQGAIFAARLQSASIDGLNLPPLRAPYMVQYKKSLIGKHYKALQQVGIFQLDAQLCSPALFELWKANGVLGALIWFPVIKNMDQYLADLTVAIDNVLDRWAIVGPTKITQKYKLHAFPHLPSAVRRFGPSVLFATEIFECWNTVFRLCSVLSNHQAPSLDIATTLADMERFKHQVSGGWWKPVDGHWTQAGCKIQTFLTGNKQLQRRIGWTSHDAYKAGSVVPVSKAKRRPDTWKSALGSAWNDTLAEPIGHANKNWIACKYAAARSQEPCFTGSWVFILDGVEMFTVSETVDDHYEIPLLLKTENTVVSKPEVCPHQAQERSESKLTRKIRAHKDDSRFLLNTHALHNAHLVRETLPRSLTAPKPCFADRHAKHSEGQATKARNKQDKVDKAAGVTARAGDPATNIE